MTRAALIAGLAMLLTLPGCGLLNRIDLFAPTGEPETPLPFEARLARSDSDPRAFTVRAEGAGATLAQVRESLRYPATSFCLLNYGTTNIAWRQGAAGEWTLERRGRDLLAAGRCEDR
ncbi:hypothetical protein [Profundibacterium mesophilum]|uniref:Uncharacterized protein n=1 Tax=Profundibacterium mesophilum KAUST100406-0324 TaxID=1037889 RepID=A0A921TDZ3_9RHOB|nr:hypothetical protein [Profundibacterium mesophilum]KAF0674864.1 hypothetical protein PMES_02940 [Profundibacterium mesophilum KAUST100406-0324]